jgi:hypothetical protein
MDIVSFFAIGSPVVQKDILSGFPTTIFIG